MSQRLFKKSAAIVGVLAVALSLGTVSCKKKSDASMSQMQMIPQVPVEKVGIGSTVVMQTYPATLRGKTDIDIRPQVAGAITKVCVDEGQRVVKGQTLFTIDQVTYQAAVEQAQAVVNSAQAAVDYAQTTASSQKMLYDKGIISEITWKQANDQLSQAKAALAQAKAALVSAQKNLSYTLVTAPSDGIVGNIPLREGSYVSPQSLLTTISDNSEMYAYFSLNENDIINLTDHGTRNIEEVLASMPAVKLQLSNGAIYPEEGKIATVSGVIDSSTGSATVRALFPNPNGMLLSGASGAVLIPQTFNDVIIIPQSATFETQDMRMVYVVTDSNTTVPTPIQVAKLSDGKNFVVTGGLTPGQHIVVQGINTVVRGAMPIQPIEETPAQQTAEAPVETQQ